MRKEIVKVRRLESQRLTKTRKLSKIYHLWLRKIRNLRKMWENYFLILGFNFEIFKVSMVKMCRGYDFLWGYIRKYNLTIIPLIKLGSKIFCETRLSICSENSLKNKISINSCQWYLFWIFVVFIVIFWLITTRINEYYLHYLHRAHVRIIYFYKRFDRYNCLQKTVAKVLTLLDICLLFNRAMKYVNLKISNGCLAAVILNSRNIKCTPIFAGEGRGTSILNNQKLTPSNRRIIKL